MRKLSIILFAWIGISVHAEDANWMLDVKIKRPQQIPLDLSLKGEEGYWYMNYEVANRTERNRFLQLNIWVEVNKDPAKRTYKDRIIPQLESTIEKNAEDQFKNRIELIGKLKKDETKQCIALFGPIGYDIETVDIYIDGLAEQTLARNIKGNYFFVTRRLHFSFKRLGDKKEEPFTTLVRTRREILYVEKPAATSAAN